ncbi:MAG: pyridoxal phosphate-dependent aminotransferase, partial [Microbacterium sp.]|nr:pyridoxal phosphate-dependent aminotransferase [Microbacterium sp.]
MRTSNGTWRRVAAGAGLVGADGTIAPTIFAEMSALAARTGAVNLGQGFPDEDGPAAVLEAARDAIAGGANQYPPGRGIPDLHEIVVFEPFYDEYAALAALAGARLVTVPLRWPDFQPDLDELRAAVGDRTRLIVVNDPHNPTGTVFSAEAREEIVRLADRHDVVIVTDEVYEHLIFDGVPHVPIATLPGAAERTVSISSAGKTFSTTGWKIGWATGPADLVDAILTVKQYLTYVNGAPFQPAIAAGLRLGDEFFAGLASDLQRKRDLLLSGLQAAGFTAARASGSYFTVADAAALGATDAHEFCRSLPERVGVVGIPLTAFALPENRAQYATLVRFAACKREDV